MSDGAMEPVKVTISDPAAGEVLEEHVIKNDFVVICAGNRYVDGVQAYPNGTQVVTVKRRDEEDD